MVKALSDKFTNYLVKRNIITDEIEIYKYGFELIISYSIGCIIILIISFMTNTFYSALIYLLTFFYLRKYTGGYHCKTYFTCNLSFISIYLLYTYLCSISAINKYITIIYIIGCISIWIYAPCDHENKILDKAEIKKYGGISKILLVIYNFILVGVYWLMPIYVIPMQFTLLIISMLLILGKLERRGEKHV